MSEKKDLVVKMTINSTEFDQGLKNAKLQMKQTENSVESLGSSFKKGFGKIALIVGGASVAVKGLNEYFHTTAQGADAVDRSIYTLETTFKKTMQTMASGRFTFNDLSNQLSVVADNALAAYDALDKLSTLKMWGNAEIAQRNAYIDELRVIVNNPNSSEAEKEDAQKRIDANLKEIKKLADDISEETQNNMRVKLREISNSDADLVSMAQLEEFLEMWKKGTLEKEMASFFSKHAKVYTWTETVYSPGGWPAYETTKSGEEWDYELNKAIYNAMAAINSAPKDDSALGAYFKLQTEDAALRTWIARMENRANNVINKDIKPNTTSSVQMQTGLTFEQEIERLNRMVFNAPIHTQWDDIIIPTEDLIEEEGIIEEETDAIVDAYTARKKALAELAKETAAAIVTANALGSAFTSIGQISGDDIFGNIAAGLGNIISQASSTISALMALAGAETVEGLAEVFAEAPPYTKIALTATALAGILSMIASAKSAFAGSFAEGGVVGGNSYTGDKLWARVNSGEMIIPYNDWHNSGTGSGQVKFVIEGSQLKGVLDNYESIQNM